MPLQVIVTTPRLPTGLLTPAAWRAIDRAALIRARSGHPLTPVLSGEGWSVDQIDQPDLVELCTVAAETAVVWLADPAGEPLIEALATEVLRRSEAGADRIDLEVVVGSFDPPGARLLDLVATTDALRRNCPWDRKQTHESLLRYLIEESYEVIDAAERGDRSELRDELGDLLWQVMFHSAIAAEDADDPWGIDDVAGGIVAKLVRRHPHVFGTTSVADTAEVQANWEQIKRTEKPHAEIFDGVPTSLPALLLADKVIGRMLSTDRPVSVPTVGAAGEGNAPSWTEDHLGDVLFALVAAAREQGIDAETALRKRVRAELDLAAHPGDDSR
jgi:XTP/dITP diphosphohydrolase